MKRNLRFAFSCFFLLLVAELLLCSCSYVSSEPEKAAKSMADQLMDKLEFDDSELRSEPAPEASSSGPKMFNPIFPSEAIPGTEFTIHCTASYSSADRRLKEDSLSEVTKTIIIVEKNGVVAENYILIRHQIDTETGLITLKGAISDDFGLFGEFLMTFALQTEGGITGEYMVWNMSVEPGQQIETLFGHNGDVWSLASTSDGSMLASGSTDNNIKLWDPATISEISTLMGESGYVRGLDFSPDGTILASANENHSVSLWDVDGESEILNLTGHQYFANAVSFCPGTNILASSGGDWTVRLWNISSGEEEQMLLGHNGTVWEVDCSPDGEIVASGSCGHFDDDGFCDEGQIMLRGVSDGREIGNYSKHIGSVRSLAFSPDGATLASASCGLLESGVCKKGEIKLWRVSDFEELATFSVHSDYPDSVVFSPDGGMLASGGCRRQDGEFCYRGEATLIRVRDGVELITLVGHYGGISSVAFCLGDSILATGSYDSTIKLWSIEGL